MLCRLRRCREINSSLSQETKANKHTILQLEYEKSMLEHQLDSKVKETSELSQQCEEINKEKQDLIIRYHVFIEMHSFS